MFMYRCETRYDLMSKEEIANAPDYDAYRGFIVVAKDPHAALYNNSLRHPSIGGTHEEGRTDIEDLIDCGLPVTDKERSDFILTTSPIDELPGRVIWQAKLIGRPMPGMFEEGQVIMSDFKAG